MHRLLLSVGLAGLLAACSSMPGGGSTMSSGSGSDTATMGGSADPSMRTRSPHGTGGPVGASGGGPG